MNVKHCIAITEKTFKETIDLLKRYLRIDTTNPPGNEIKAANFFSSICEKELIDHEIVESEPGRASIKATLRGDGTKKPVILLNHMDVVPAEESSWSHPPFAARQKDGFIYARGAQDMKTTGLLQFMTMVLLKRTQQDLNRDVIFLGCAGEETGGKLGAGYLIENDPDLQKADFCINEGGSIWRTKSGDLIYKIGFTEKVPSRFKVKALGKPGHSSIPHVDNCNLKLVRALDRLNNHSTPIQVIPLIKSLLKTTSRFEEGKLREILQDIEKAVENPENVKLLEEKYPYYNSLIRDTISLNMIQSGEKANVIPSQGWAVYDARILPENSRDEFISRIKEVVKDIPVEVELLESKRPAPRGIIESCDSEFYMAVSDLCKELTPGAEITPSMMTGASDSQYFRNVGVPSYGFTPLIFDSNEKGRVHGHDERISIENVRFGLNFMCKLMEKIAVKKKTRAI